MIGNSSDEWERARKSIKEVFEPAEDAAHYTAKTQLDEMMILDRWLRSHGGESCVAWMNAENKTGYWAAGAAKQLKQALIETAVS